MRSLLVLTFFLLQIQSLLSQNRVQLVSGEILEGKISIDLPSIGYETIVIKEGKQKTKLRAHEFVSFDYKENMYIPLKIGSYYRIMKEQVSGYLSLYYYREDGSYEFGSQYLYKKDGQGLYVPNLSFKRQVFDFLDDCSSIEENFENNEYKKADLVQIVEDYNKCIHEKTLKSKLNVNKITDTVNPSIALIETIKKKISDQKSELNTLLTDIQAKLVQRQTIPEYLKSALKDQSTRAEDLQEDIEKLLESI